MTKKNLLIDEYPLLVLPSLATAIGLNEAIALQQLHYWIGNSKGGVEMDGERWTYNTYEEWQEDNFPFWSVRTVQRVFLNLEELGLVISKQEASYDRKKYYRVHYANLARWNTTNPDVASGQDGTMDDDKVARSIKGITETIAETTRKPDMLDAILESERQTQPIREATNFFESAFGFGALNWDSKPEWRKFALWITEIYKTDSGALKDYVTWRLGDGRYQAMSNNKIRQNPQMFMDTGWPTFLAHTSMYGNKEPQYKPIPEDTNVYVRNPLPKPRIAAH